MVAMYDHAFFGKLFDLFHSLLKRDNALAAWQVAHKKGFYTMVVVVVVSSLKVFLLAFSSLFGLRLFRAACFQVARVYQQLLYLLYLELGAIIVPLVCVLVFRKMFQIW